MYELNLNDLSIEQKIGQLIVARRWDNKEDVEFVFEMLEKKAVGAVQVIYYEGCEELIAKIQEKAGYPILVCADMEHGFPGSELKVPAQMSISATNDMEYAYELARAVAIEAKNAGYNVVWGPVVDLAAEGALCKNTRCFSDNVKLVSEYACAMIRGYQDEGMVVSAKHYPGASDILDDQHMLAGVSERSEEELLLQDLIPYIEAIKKANLSGIMTAHNLFPKIDNRYVASLSKKIIDIIRNLGFDGLIFTDSLAMFSVVNKYGIKECLGLAVAAGNDLILPNYRLTFRESYEYLLSAYHAGVFDEERLNNAVRHVLEAQHKTLAAPSACKLTTKQRNRIGEISKYSLCAQVKEGTQLKLDDNTKKAVILVCENSYKDLQKSNELQNGNWYVRSKIEERKKLVEEEFPGANVVIISEHPNRLETEEVCLAIAEAEEAIVFTFCMSSSYTASDGLTERIKYIIKVNENKISTIVHMGNPYVLADFKNTPRLLWGTIGGECEEYAIKALKGQYVPMGKIPVKL